MVDNVSNQVINNYGIYIYMVQRYVTKNDGTMV